MHEHLPGEEFIRSRRSKEFDSQTLSVIGTEFIYSTYETGDRVRSCRRDAPPKFAVGSVKQSSVVTHH